MTEEMVKRLREAAPQAIEKERYMWRLHFRDKLDAPCTAEQLEIPVRRRMRIDALLDYIPEEDQHYKSATSYDGIAFLLKDAEEKIEKYLEDLRSGRILEPYKGCSKQIKGD